MALSEVRGGGGGVSALSIVLLGRAHQFHQRRALWSLRNLLRCKT